MLHTDSDILAQTGIDFGFPKSQVANLSGETGALIEGIRGKTVDPEELTNLHRNNGSQEDVDEVTKSLQEIPEKLSAKSLQKVVLFSTLSCQWDCKWGNLMVENDTDARPIDGGGAFPNQDAVDSFGQDYNVVPLALITLTQYPPTSAVGDKQGQTLPQALEPMDEETVQSLLKLDADRLAQTLKSRRDDITQKHPDLAPPPHTAGLVDDATIDRVKTSIKLLKISCGATPARRWSTSPPPTRTGGCSGSPTTVAPTPSNGRTPAGPGGRDDLTNGSRGWQCTAARLRRGLLETSPVWLYRG